MNAPMRIYVPVMDGEPLSSWHYSTSPYAPEKDVEFIRADIHDAQIDALKAENAELTSALSVIHELAHNESTGPVFEDGYWAIRGLAGEALGVK